MDRITINSAHSLRFLVISLLLAAPVACADATADPTWESAKATYAKDVEAIRAKAEQDEAKAKARLEQVRQAAIKRAMAKGDLATANTIKDEAVGETAKGTSTEGHGDTSKDMAFLVGKWRVANQVWIIEASGKITNPDKAADDEWRYGMAIRLSEGVIKTSWGHGLNYDPREWNATKDPGKYTRDTNVPGVTETMQRLK